MGVAEPYEIRLREEVCIKKQSCVPDEQYFHIPEGEPEEEDEDNEEE